MPDSCDATPAEAADGVRYARAVSGEGLEQAVPTVAGTTYALSFAYCGVSECFGSDPNSSWDILVDGVVADTTPASGTTDWQTHGFAFVAQGPMTTICLRRSASLGQGGIDDLSLVAQ